MVQGNGRHGAVLQYLRAASQVKSSRVQSSPFGVSPRQLVSLFALHALPVPPTSPQDGVTLRRSHSTSQRRRPLALCGSDVCRLGHLCSRFIAPIALHKSWPPPSHGLQFSRSKSDSIVKGHCRACHCVKYVIALARQSPFGGSLGSQVHVGIYDGPTSTYLRTVSSSPTTCPTSLPGYISQRSTLIPAILYARACLSLATSFQIEPKSLDVPPLGPLMRPPELTLQHHHIPSAWSGKPGTRRPSFGVALKVISTTGYVSNLQRLFTGLMLMPPS